MYTLHHKIKKDDIVSYYGKEGDIGLRINRQDFKEAGLLHTDPLHFHKKSIQFFIVTEGIFHVKVDGTFIEVDKDSILEIKPGTVYQDYEVLVAPCTCFTIGTHNDEGDSVTVED